MHKQTVIHADKLQGADLLNQLMRTNGNPDIQLLPDLIALLMTPMDEINSWQEKQLLEDCLDGYIEMVLEHLTALARQDKTLFVAHAGMSVERLIRLICDHWLQPDEIETSCEEISIRAAQLLGVLSAIAGEEVSLQLNRIRSDRYELRMWGARALRALNPDDLADLLAPLKDDPFEDKDGYFPVREAADLLLE